MQEGYRHFSLSQGPLPGRTGCSGCSVSGPEQATRSAAWHRHHARAGASLGRAWRAVPPDHSALQLCQRRNERPHEQDLQRMQMRALSIFAATSGRRLRSPPPKVDAGNFQAKTVILGFLRLLFKDPKCFLVEEL